MSAEGSEPPSAAADPEPPAVRPAAGEARDAQAAQLLLRQRKVRAQLRELEQQAADSVDLKAVVLPAAANLSAVIHELIAAELGRTADAVRIEESLADRVRAMRLRELLDQDLTTILDLLDHTPPPESVVLALMVQEAVGEVLASRASGALPMVHKRAVEGLYYYAYHLDRLIAAAHTAAPGGEDGGRGDALLDLVKRGAPVLAASGLGAAVDTLIAPGAGSLAMVALLPKVGGEAGRSTLVSGVELGANAVVGKLLAAEKAQATPYEQLKVLFELVWRYGAVFVGSASPPGEPPTAALQSASTPDVAAGVADAAGIALLSGLYEIAALALGNGELAGWEWVAQQAIAEVNRCRSEGGRFDTGLVADYGSLVTQRLSRLR